MNISQKFFRSRIRKSATGTYDLMVEGFAVSDLPKSIRPRAVFTSEGDRKIVPVRMMYLKLPPYRQRRKNGESISWAVYFVLNLKELAENPEENSPEKTRQEGMIDLYGEVTSMVPEGLTRLAEQDIGVRIREDGILDASGYEDGGELILLDRIQMKDIRKGLADHCFGISDCVREETDAEEFVIHGWSVTDHEPDLTVRDLKTGKHLSIQVAPEKRTDILWKYPEAYWDERKSLYPDEQAVQNMLDPGFRITVKGKAKSVRIYLGFRDHVLTWDGRVREARKGEKVSLPDPEREAEQSLRATLRIFGTSEIRNTVRKRVRLRMNYGKWLEKQKRPVISDSFRKADHEVSFAFLIPEKNFTKKAEENLRKNLSGQGNFQWEVRRVKTASDLANLTDSWVVLMEKPLRFDDSFLPRITEVIEDAEKTGTGDLNLIYTDEDELGINGQRRYPKLKPDFDPDYLTSVNYIGNAPVIRRDTFHKILSAYHQERGNQEDLPEIYDLLLRISEQNGRVRHIPEVLVSKYSEEFSKSAEMREMDQAQKLAEDLSALQHHLIRIHQEDGIQATAEMGELPGRFHTVYEMTKKPLISVILCGADALTLTNRLSGEDWKEELQDTGKNPEWEDRCHKSRQSFYKRSPYQNYEFIDTYDYMEEFRDAREARDSGKCRVSDQCNKAVTASEGDYLLFLEAGTTLLHSGSVVEMISCLMNRADVGAIGGKIYCSDGTIRHGCGKLPWQDKETEFYKGNSMFQDAFFQYRRVPCLQRGAVMVKRADFDLVGGFDAAFSGAYMMEDLTLRLRERGLRVLYDGIAGFQLKIPGTRTADSAFYTKRDQKKEEACLRKKWNKV